MALLLCERQPNWLRVVTVVFGTIGINVITSTFFTFFYVFFKIQKVVIFYVFCRLAYVFSNYDFPCAFTCCKHVRLSNGIKHFTYLLTYLLTYTSMVSVEVIRRVWWRQQVAWWRHRLVAWRHWSRSRRVVCSGVVTSAPRALLGTLQVTRCLATVHHFQQQLTPMRQTLFS